MKQNFPTTCFEGLTLEMEKEWVGFDQPIDSMGLVGALKKLDYGRVQQAFPKYSKGGRLWI